MSNVEVKGISSHISNELDTNDFSGARIDPEKLEKIRFQINIAERGYDPSTSKELTNDEAIDSIAKIFNQKNAHSLPMIVCNGKVGLKIRTESFVAADVIPNLAIGGGDQTAGLFLHSLAAIQAGEVEQFFIVTGENSTLTKPEHKPFGNYIDFSILDEGGREYEISIANHMDVGVAEYQPFQDAVVRDASIWRSVTSAVDLDLNEKAAEYTDKQVVTPWYTSTHAETGVEFTFGSRYRVYAVRATFPNVQEPESLQAMVEGLRVSPQSVDTSWVGNQVDRKGHTFEVHIDKGRAYEMVSLIQRMLAIQS